MSQLNVSVHFLHTLIYNAKCRFRIEIHFRILTVILRSDINLKFIQLTNPLYIEVST